MEGAVSGTATLPDLQRVRDAVLKVQHASAKLDVEKLGAEEAFRKAMQNIPRGWFDHGIVRRIKIWIKRLLAIGSPESDNVELEFSALHTLSTLSAFTEQSPCKGSLCDLIRAAIRVKKVNQKLSLFERGFISEGGIKDREWFRHLGVAPGKYLGESSSSLGEKHSLNMSIGYGAATLPALSEAILYEKNATLVEHEVIRLTTLLTQLAYDIEP